MVSKKVSSSSLHYLEKKINNNPFLGYDVGYSISDWLAHGYYYGKNPKVRTIFSAACRYYLWKYRYKNSSSTNNIGISKRILFTSVSDRKDMVDLIAPIIRKFEPEECTVISNCATDVLRREIACPIYQQNTFTTFSLGTWRREFDRCFKLWRIEIKEFQVKHNLPFSFNYYVKYALAVQTQSIMSSIVLIDSLQPRVIVTQFSRSRLNSTLSLVAMQRKIPVITMVHGALDEYSFTPFIADQVLCWGYWQVARLESMGHETSKTEVVGYHSATVEDPSDSLPGYNKNSMVARKPRIMLALSSVSLINSKFLINCFLDALHSDKSVTLCIRLHPANDVSEFSDIVNKYPDVIFQTKKDDKNKSIGLSDIVIVCESTFAVDCLLKGKLIVIFNPRDEPIVSLTEFIENGISPSINTSSALRKHIDLLLTNVTFRLEALKKMQSFSNVYFDCSGDLALSKIKNAIVKIS
jgi:hypothetical protein